MSRLLRWLAVGWMFGIISERLFGIDVVSSGRGRGAPVEEA